jgi:hypothetical protein
VKLAKDVIDFDLYTNDREPMLGFWQEDVGLPFEENLPAGGGVHQLQHGMNGSVMKINHARDPLPEAGPSGYRELRIARSGLDAERLLSDPQGNRVRLLPSGQLGVTGIGLLLGVLARSRPRCDDLFTSLPSLQARPELSRTLCPSDSLTRSPRAVPRRPARVKRIEAGWSPRSSGGPGDPRASEIRTTTPLRGTTLCARPTKPQALRKNGVHGRFGPTRLDPILIRDRPAARQSFERILAWDFDRVVIARGEVLEAGGPAALRAGYDWLLAGWPASLGSAPTLTS